MPPISTSAFGTNSVCSRSRVPRPPQRIATGGFIPGIIRDRVAAMSGAEETTLGLAPAPGGDRPSNEDLLRRHRPYLLWDSQDDYRPLSIGSILENPGNLLK